MEEKNTENQKEKLESHPENQKEKLESHQENLKNQQKGRFYFNLQNFLFYINSIYIEYYL